VRAVVVVEHSFFPSTQVQVPPLHTGVSPEQSDCAFH
jgi:hypothetical protein